MADIVEDLRRARGSRTLRTVMLGMRTADAVCLKAADEIERLRAALDIKERDQ